MTVDQADRIYGENFKYYTLFVFPCKTKMGYGDRAYKRKANAERRMKQLVESGEFESIMMRENEVWKRDDKNEFGSSSPIKKWEDGKYALCR